MKISHAVTRKDEGYETTISIYNENDQNEPAVHATFSGQTAKEALVGARLKMLAIFEEEQSRVINQRIEVGNLLLSINTDEYNEEEVANR